MPAPAVSRGCDDRSPARIIGRTHRRGTLMAMLATAPPDAVTVIFEAVNVDDVAGSCRSQ
jgi:hypothetical protein